MKLMAHKITNVRLFGGSNAGAIAPALRRQRPFVPLARAGATSELCAAMSMARLRRDQGKRAEARELLAAVYGWFTEGCDTRDLKEGRRRCSMTYTPNNNFEQPIGLLADKSSSGCKGTDLLCPLTDTGTDCYLGCR
jgi:hypothetical protein